MELKNIVIISPQDWDHLLVSKQHYALELVEMGFRVYFINPPNLFPHTKIKIFPSSNNESLSLVTFGYLLPFHLFFKYHFRFIYDLQLKIIVKKIIKRIGSIDEIWNFNPTVFFDTSYYKANKEILFLYDYYDLAKLSLNMGRLNLIVSISSILLEPFSKYSIPLLKINHGISKPFIKLAEQRIKDIDESNGVSNFENLKVGYSGNILHHQFDWKIFKQIIQENPSIEFHIWGEYSDNKVYNLSHDLINFLTFLRLSKNVYLKPKVNSEELALQYSHIDLFLCCYDMAKTFNSGNSHKIMEYLATGKIVVSNLLEELIPLRNLILMPDSVNNSVLPKLFKNAITNLNFYNSPIKSIDRCNISLQNTYYLNIAKIHSLISENK